MAKKEDEKKDFEVVEVATQTDIVIHDTTTNEQLSIAQALVEILNDVREIKKNFK